MKKKKRKEKLQLSERKPEKYRVWPDRYNTFIKIIPLLNLWSCSALVRNNACRSLAKIGYHEPKAKPHGYKYLLCIFSFLSFFLSFTLFFFCVQTQNTNNWKETVRENRRWIMHGSNFPVFLPPQSERKAFALYVRVTKL